MPLVGSPSSLLSLLPEQTFEHRNKWDFANRWPNLGRRSLHVLMLRTWACGRIVCQSRLGRRVYPKTSRAFTLETTPPPPLASVVNDSTKPLSCHLITTIPDANEWACRVIQDVSLLLDCKRTIHAGLYIHKSYPWNKEFTPLTMELSVETQPVVVFCFSHLKRFYKHVRGPRDDSGFPKHLKELLESPFLRACGFSIEYDVRHLKKFDVHMNQGVFNIRKLAQRHGFDKEGVSFEAICRHYLSATASCGEDSNRGTLKFDTALRYRLAAQTIRDLLRERAQERRENTDTTGSA
jgi:hypothetical protein